MRSRPVSPGAEVRACDVWNATLRQQVACMYSLFHYIFSTINVEFDL